MTLKIFEKRLVYLNRDFLYKSNIDNAYKKLAIKNLTVLCKLPKTHSDIFPVISSSILIFDRLPYLLRIKHTHDKKILGAIIGCSLTIDQGNWPIFLSNYFLNTEKGSAAFELLLNDSKDKLFFFNFTSLFQFKFLYDKFMLVQDFSVRINFVNCFSDLEKSVFLSGVF